MRRIACWLALVLLLALTLTACTDDAKKDPTETGGGIPSTPIEETAASPFENEGTNESNPSSDGDVDFPRVDF